MAKKRIAPKESVGDKTHALAKAAIGSIPIPGAAVGAELISWLITPPVQERQQAFMNEIAESLARLESQRAVPISKLRDNPAFVDTFLQVSRIAVATSDEDKRAYLRNAILNSALPSCPDATRRAMYLRWIEVLTAWHIRMLDFFQNPIEWYARNGRQLPEFKQASNYHAVWILAYPKMRAEPELCEQIANQLTSEGLANLDHFRTVRSGSGVYGPNLSRFGNELLDFVRSPLQAVPIGPGQLGSRR